MLMNRQQEQVSRCTPVCRVSQVKLLSSWFCCLLFLCQAAGAFSQGADALLAQVDPGSIEASSSETNSVDANVADAAAENINELMSRLSTIEASETLEPNDKAILTDLYQRAIENFKAAEDNRLKGRQYIERMNGAPSRLQELQQELDSVRSIPPASTELSTSALEQELLQEQSELLRLRNMQAELNSRALAEQQNTSGLLEEALQNQAAALAQANRAPAAESLERENAWEVFELSEISAANSRVDMLRQRMLSRDSRLQVLDRERQLLDRQIKATSTVVTLLENRLNEVRQAEAELKARETQQREAQISSAQPEIKSLAGENAELAAELSEVAARTDTLLKQLEALRQERARVDRYYSSMTQQLAVAGADRLAGLSVDLLAQRQQFSQNLPPAIDTTALDKELTTTHMRQLKLEDRQLAVTEEESSTASGLKQELLTERQQLIQQSVNSYRRYTSALMDVLSENNGLQARMKEYRNLLDSRLFWIPSVSPLHIAFFHALSAEVQALFDLSRWQKMLSPAYTSVISWLTGFGLLLIAMGTFLWQPRLKRRLEQWGQFVGKVNKDKLSYTILVLLVSIALAVPAPALVLALAAWAPPGAVEQGLLHTAMMWFAVGLFFQTCREGGLADVHFHWDKRLLKKVRGHCLWFMLALTPPLFLMPIANLVGGTHQVISRLLFGAVAVILFIGLHAVLKQAFSLRPARPLKSSVKSPTSAASISPQRSILLYSIYILLITLPVLMWVLSWMGYHFTAQAIQDRLFITLLLLALLLIGYSLAIRAVSVLERRLKLERLVAQRIAEREQRANRQAANETGEIIPEVLEAPEVHMEQVSQQSRAFVGWFVALIGFYLLWNVWDSLLPALNVFNNMQLWNVASSDPGIPVRVVTVLDLLLAIIVLVLSYLGVRNLPGVLEISVLRVMNLKLGASYAITTVVKYAIVLVGVVAALNLIGVQWSKLQWLIAAIGVGLGFGLQEILANFVSGLLILFEQPIRVGDTVTVGGHTGTVSKIRIRATTLTDGDRKEQIIPNKIFITGQLTNWTLSDPTIRCVIKVGVAYGTDVLVVHKLLAGVLADNPRVMSEPSPAVFFVGFGANSLDFELQAFVPTLGDQTPLKHELHIAINKTFVEHNIVMPFPQQDIWIREDQRLDNNQ